MVVLSESSRLILKSALSMTSRVRFSSTLGVCVAVACGISIVRWISYLTLIAVQFREADASQFTQIIATASVALWMSFVAFALVNAKSENTLDMLLLGTAKATPFSRRWRVALLVCRPLTIVPVAVTAASVVLSRRWNPDGLVEFSSNLVLGVALAVATIIAITRLHQNGRTQIVSGSITVAVIAVAVLGPDFTVSAGTIRPIVLGRVIAIDASWLIVQSPILLSSSVIVSAVMLSRLRNRPVSRRNAHQIRPIWNLFNRVFPASYWASVAAFLLVLAALDRLSIPGLILVFVLGGLVPVTVVHSRVSTVVGSARLLRSVIGRRLSALAGFSGALHLLFAVGSEILASRFLR